MLWIWPKGRWRRLSGATSPKPRSTWISSRETRDAWLFLSPVVALVVVFSLLPVLGTLWTSFFRDVSFMPLQFVGWENYRDLVVSREFLGALRFTVVFTLVAVMLETVLGMIFALALHETFSGRGLVRAAMLLPWAIPTIVSAKLWKQIFDYHYGLLNGLLPALGIAQTPVNWLGTSGSAFAAIVTAEVWKTTPFMVILLLAGLQAIPPVLYDQARIDGAGMFTRFYRITLVLIRPVLVIALVFRTIDSLRIFDLVFVLTGGGPGGGTKSLSMMGYEYFVADRFGAGSAVSMATFALAMVATLFYLRAGRFREQLAR